MKSKRKNVKINQKVKKLAKELKPTQTIENTSKNQINEKCITVILTKCSLEIAKINGKLELLDGNKHKNYLLSKHKNIIDYRPDISHQCLLMLQDSPLNRVGQLNVYLKTINNVLIKINPQTRIPRTFDRFSGLMVQLLQKLSIRATDSSTKLLSIIANPVSKYLSLDSIKIVTSCHVEYKENQLEPFLNNSRPLVFYIGAMSHGSQSVDDATESISFGSHPLSGALACAKLCTIIENYRNIF
ncbi:hypothetical protein A3Q56_05399 [Intoshia linei]|uniref:Ribosomal RNA small subunit methyltransferase NEP1 n=1 Tax=Intoshia linei TaxID=1819745 RepID=A0A177AXZ5_9BILA|nr:hypothetical protein A3Q56_05399 [Intoshia linei]